MKQIVVHSPGSPQAMQVEDVPTPQPAADQVLVDVAACGVNFIDTYQRSGVYPVPMPHPLGLEGAGVVREVGADVDFATVGDHVAWAGSRGSYAEQVLLGAQDCYRVPEGVDLTVAAALMLQGLTAHYLSASTFPLGADHTALVHAGAGGVGLLLTQLAVARGARVITTVSTSDKEALSREAGASDVIRYDQFDSVSDELPAAVRSLTDGAGVDVVYDGVGATTFDGSLASLKPRGMLALFGGSSGQVPPFDLQRLSRAGSMYVTRPSMGHYLATAEERSWRAEELFGAVRSGNLNVRIGETFPFDRAGEAHAALEGRRTTGKVVLIP
ncbi:quinone oxidoreductase family protein [Demequina flava]|uniref:quinone oxidoreductase family protein n=1 Tax=Demequina flava TaxID=1095025 RepID=UPI00078380A1|nr:quinone oxidoreductase [Demequina flava]